MKEREPSNVAKDVLKTEAVILMMAAAVFMLFGLLL
jgi:hypothetical protein